MNKILIVEDDIAIVKNLSQFLRSEGFEIEYVTSQKDALNIIEEKEYDLILLDVSLGDGNGFAVCSAIKKNKSTPVIFLTASDDEYSVVTGLDLGADDYIEKPFDLLELIARVDSKKRRIKKSDKIEIGKIVLNRSEHKVFIDQRLIDLTQKEYELLNLLMESYPDCVSREDIFKKIWNYDEILESRTLDVHVKSLRSKLGSESSSIETVYGVGYRFKK